MFKKKILKKALPFAVLSTVFVGSLIGPGAQSIVQAQETTANNQSEVKNVIFLIGDGMGTSYTSAYRYFKDDRATPFVEKTEFDKYLVGQQMTYPEDEKASITDSASAATAMSSGIKTFNNAIAVDNDKSRVKTVLEAAKEAGKSTGLVATSEITHATPAAFGAHNESRKNMDAIADDYYNERINGEHTIDVLLGGGKSNFVRTDVNLTDSFKQDGFSYVTTKEELLKDGNDQVLGLFADGGLPKMIDRTDAVPSLADMTTTAIDRLSKNDEGFFLMVEGSQIDWAGHANDVVGTMSEMEDFEQAFKAAIDFAKADGQTLVITTADHSTGGFAIGADGSYNWSTDSIKAAKRTPGFMAGKIAEGANVENTLKMYIDQTLLPLTAEEINVVKAAGKKASDIETVIKAIFDKRSFTGWTTGGHTGEDVPVYAYGPSKERFAGLKDNTDHAKVLFELLNLGSPSEDKH
ncbi:alkaline phosphatase [Solibacillus sp. FSL K6-1523]|uniref:alkaline phosphatase n=1 Tax=Solibacillus sp. FSL K6-1523 TaxID=2921471 RepID=UPI0030FC551E